MKAVIIILIFLISVSSYASDLSDYDRGFADGQMTCQFDTFYVCSLDFLTDNNYHHSLFGKGLSQSRAKLDLVKSPSCWSYNQDECLEAIKNGKMVCEQL